MTVGFTIKRRPGLPRAAFFLNFRRNACMDPLKDIVTALFHRFTRF
ncbi:hypothetical protein [Oscillibacter sp.]|nr:hypothetical protein [Oscillibacter sp.]